MREIAAGGKLLERSGELARIESALAGACAGRGTRVFDTVRQREWPAPYTGRALRNLFLEQWHDHDAALAENLAEHERYRAAAEAGDFDTALVWAGEVADLIDRIEPASTIIERIGNQAEAWLSQAQKLVTESVDQTGS